MTNHTDRRAPMLTQGATVCALVPHFACEAWLDQALASLVAQTRPLDGIVVIDDSSAEPPTAIVERFEGVTLLRAATNVGPYRLIQQVIDQTRFDAYLFQDADDWSAPDRLARLLAAAEATGAELVGSDYCMVSCEEAATELHAFPLDANAVLAEAPTCHALQHPTSLVARSLVERLGGYASGMRFSGDDEFLRRAAHVTRVVNVPRALYFRRQRTDSLTTSSTTGHGSDARRDILRALATRAEANAEASARGGPVHLEPFSRGGPVRVEHLCGPVPGATSAVSGAPDRRGRSRGRRVPPIVVIGPGGAQLLACSLGQHSTLAHVPDVSWLAQVIDAATASPAAVRLPRGADRSVGPLDAVGVAPARLAAALRELLDELAANRRLPPADPHAAEDEIETTLRDVAGRRLTNEAGWVAAMTPESATQTVSVLSDARVLHVVPDPGEALALGSPHPDEVTSPAPYRSWLDSARACLGAERAAGPARVLRIPLTDLVTGPEETMRRCLDFVGLRYEEATTWPLRHLPVPVGPARITQDVAANPAYRQALDLATALCGPRPEPAVRRDPSPVPRREADRGAEPSSPAAALTLLRAAVPPGAIVAVASKGDDRLLDLGPATGWHFPRTPDGTWAGHYPADSAAAIAHLAELRAAGARYLFIPEWASWWLDYYRELGEYVERNGRVVASQADAGVLFDLGAGGDDSEASMRDDTVAAPGVVRHGRRKVAVLPWSVAHNPLGRAHLLAELLRDEYDVELIGATFERFGRGVWEPHRNSALPIRSFAGGPFPEHLRRMEEMAAGIDADALLVGKPRLPSLGLGILAKAQRDRPLVLDVDDRELAFVGADRGISLDEVASWGDNPSLLNPYGRLWTQHCESLVGDADEVLVSNDTLGALYGGTVIPHARDETVFDPRLYDRDAVRARLGFAPEERIVLFAGTPRAHKGIRQVAEALRAVGDERLRLCLLATSELNDLGDELAGLEQWIRLLPYQPFDQLPALLAASDLVCALQDPASEVARYQIPAKITDALAMQVPCVVTRVPPLDGLIAAGHLEQVGDTPLPDRIAALFDDYSAVKRRAVASREVFLEAFSYRAVRPVLSSVIESALDSPSPSPASFGQLVDFWRSRFGEPLQEPLRGATLRPPPTVRREPVEPRPDAYDVVMFWKQNDTGIYGRRHDMLMAQLAASDRVRQVIQFDAPVDLAALSRADAGGVPSHGHLVRERSLLRREGVSAGPKLHQYTYVRGDGELDGGAALGADADYLRYVSSALDRHGVGEAPVVFWVYPKSFEFPLLADALGPDVVVMDVVDDHRTWTRPGSSYHERLERNYREIAERAHVVMANCMQTQEMAAQWVPVVHLVPNGCEFPAGVEGTAWPPELAGLDGPLVGYVGNLSSRLDVPLLERMAIERPDWNLVLVGSAHAGNDVMRLARHDNVLLSGPRPYEEAKSFVQAFDVGIIPHLDNDMTRAMNPLKAYVYCSLGVPVVSTDIANLDGLRPFMRVATNHDGFMAAVDDAIRAGRQPMGAGLQAYLADNVWDRRVDVMLDLVDQVHRTSVVAR